MYNQQNIFYKIINQTIPCKKIYENTHALSFYDINPKAKIHVLVIPKGQYRNITEFTQASNQEQQDLFACINQTLEILQITKGFRIISNTGEHGGQEVDHFHFHILGGEKLSNF